MYIKNNMTRDFIISAADKDGQNLTIAPGEQAEIEDADFDKLVKGNAVFQAYIDAKPARITVSKRTIKGEHEMTDKSGDAVMPESLKDKQPTEKVKRKSKVEKQTVQAEVASDAGIAGEPASA